MNSIIGRVSGFFKEHAYGISMLVASVAAFVAVLSLFATLTVSRTSNDECLWTDIDKGDTVAFRFNKVKINGAAYNAGVRDGDILLKIDGKSFKSSSVAQVYIDRIEAGKPVEYTVKHNTTVFTTMVHLKKLISFNDLAFGLLSLIWLAIGFIVYMAKREGEVQQLFFKIGVTFAITRCLPIFYPFLPGILRTPGFFLVVLIIIVTAVFHSIWFHQFFHLFPQPSKFNSKRSRRIVFYSITGAVGLLSVVFASWILLSDRALFSLNLGQIFIPINLLTLYVYIDGFVQISKNLYRHRKSEQVRPLAWITVAYFLAILSVLFVVFVPPSLGYVVFNSPEYYTPVVLIILLPIAFAYTIFKYQMMEVSYVIQGTVIYLGATIAIAAAYFLIVYGLGFAAGQIVPPVYQGITTLLFFILFALIFQSSKDKLQNGLTKKFYPEQFALRQSLMGFRSQLAGTVGAEKLYYELKKLFVEKIGVREFRVILRSKDGKYSCCPWDAGCGEEVVLSCDEPALLRMIEERIQSGTPPVFDREVFADLLGESAPNVVDHGFYTLVPMTISTNIIGFFLIGLKRSGLQFGGKDNELLFTVGQQAAVAFENARLYASEAEKQKMEYDLEVARNIQLSLLPKEIPDFAEAEVYGKMISALQVGGDYFDIISPSPDRIFAIVGDVSGKGLPASLYMTKIQTLMQTACSNGHTPKEILIEVNKKLFKVLDRHSFVTLNIALFDFSNRTVRFCRAGHPPLAIFQNGMISEVKSRGLGLGLEEGTLFASTLEEEVIPMEKGQLFMLYSDGMNEAMNPVDDCFTTPRLLKVANDAIDNSCEAIADSLWSNLERFRSFAPQHDDMTLVLLKIRN